MGTGKHIKLWTDPWLKTGTTLRSMFIGSLPQSHDTFTVSNVLKDNEWNRANFCFGIPGDIEKTINKQYLPLYTQQQDQLLNGQFTVQTTYKKKLTKIVPISQTQQMISNGSGTCQSNRNLKHFFGYLDIINYQLSTTLIT